MSKPRLLDLFCGGGGAAKGYADAGFEVVGVDHVAQPNYPFDFERADALVKLRHLIDRTGDVAATVDMAPGFILSDFDAIHASPPCQAYSAVTGDERRGGHPDLIAETRELLRATGLPYVIENVERAPLINPIRVCGSGLNLGVRRHRLFETNFPFMGVPCAHGGQAAKFDVYEHGHWYKSPFAKVYGSGGGKAKEHWGEAMGIDWMTDGELQEAIPPAYAEHVGGYLLSHLQAVQKAA